MAEGEVSAPSRVAGTWAASAALRAQRASAAGSGADTVSAASDLADSRSALAARPTGSLGTTSAACWPTPAYRHAATARS
ncbi:hypothetical protein [Streptomyces sp. NPDC052107]|uniref:hypothetical protein n=1 Tax=Streptomyces sp. NPDC052107 TaxID=3155632 RepID=UPI0034173BDF